jgi:hypothetical protein
MGYGVVQLGVLALGAILLSERYNGVWSKAIAGDLVPIRSKPVSDSDVKR